MGKNNQKTMSIYHSDRGEKPLKFKKEVKKWLDKNNLPYTRIIALTTYGGHVRVYRGTSTERLSKRLVMQKDEGGYFRSKTIITEKDYYTFYPEEWENDMEDEFMQREIIKFFTKKP